MTEDTTEKPVVKDPNEMISEICVKDYHGNVLASHSYISITVPPKQRKAFLKSGILTSPNNLL